MIRVSEGLMTPEACLLGLRMAACSLCPRVVFPLCACMPGVSSSSRGHQSNQIRALPYDFI